MPNATERQVLWQSTIPPKTQLAYDANPNAIVGRYELSGSPIVSVVHYESLQSINRQSNVITTADLLEGIKREYEKEEKVFTTMNGKY